MCYYCVIIYVLGFISISKVKKRYRLVLPSFLVKYISKGFNGVHQVLKSGILELGLKDAGRAAIAKKETTGGSRRVTAETRL
mmetsp:Transcript_26055/g.47256  ORF Transcript_26055/g.47256 Transcript_26055/m.47256 type:complete len:82 (+) Transcript_26055:31-276(+)